MMVKWFSDGQPSYNTMVDIDTNMFNHVSTLFTTAGLELIRIPEILNHPDTIETLPCDIQNKEKIPMIRYQLGNTVRIKVYIKLQRNSKIYFFADKKVALSFKLVCAIFINFFYQMIALQKL